MGIDWTATVLAPILAVLIPIVVAGLSIMGGIWLNRLRAKEAASEALLKDELSKSVAKQAVAAVEETSAHLEKTGNDPLTPQQKESLGKTFILDRIPDKPVEQLTGDIKAALGATAGVGASVIPEVKP